MGENMNNEPVAWMDKYGNICLDIDKKMNRGKITARNNYDANDIPLYTHPAKTQELLDEIEDLKLQNKYLKGCKPNIEIVAENEALKAKVKWYDNTFRLPTDTHPAKTLTDEEIWDLYHNHQGLNRVIDFAKAILRKAQEK